MKTEHSEHVKIYYTNEITMNQDTLKFSIK